ncbi:lipoprotein-releasing ABC transporter permease subunit LolE [Thalassotalea sp. HSM 43]|uniref:lipoprotein-releasing ABC transporter permease subunit LolE n=1 Tax=Thalassotalea sp. HSM 43 TaxID=2552945 RepID=UPI001081B86D|nr:lipoprotein-releasing ABC transporter permease subunit LolE [Thalassotalea sp. HSM 43]QBY03165.1 lipoprotein-releasing ABC transporter permease subunit LolE [Thalassotalea sp. HSM 43]
MFRPLSAYIGLRYVRSRQNKGFASFISASSTIGIGLGVMVLILVLSAMNGFERELAKRLLSVVPHGEFIAVTKPIDNWQQQVETLEQFDTVTHAAPVVKLGGLLQKGERLKALELRAVVPDYEIRVSRIEDFITEGSFSALTGNSMVVGKGIAKKLKVGAGDTVQLLLPRNSSGNGQFAAPIKRNMNIVAVFDFGGSIDETLAYIPLELGQSIAEIGDKVHGLRIATDDVFAAPKIVREIGMKLDSYVYMNDWTRTQGHVFNDIQLVRTVMFVVMLLVIAVASFNIVSSLFMAVNDKKSDIAILKTMGAKPSTLMFSFVFQGLTNGVLGALIGALLGAYLANNLTDIVLFVEQSFGVKFLSGDIYFIDFIPTELDMRDVVFTVISALVLSLLATIYPAWRASKIDPAKVLGQGG